MDFSLLWNYRVNKKFEKAESVGEVFNRVNNFLENLKEEYPDKTVLLVTHGGISVPIRAFLKEYQKEWKYYKVLDLIIVK